MQTTQRVKRDLSLRDVLAILRRQRVTVFVVFIACLAAGAVAFRMTKPLFRTSLSILVSTQSPATDDPSIRGNLVAPSTNIGDQVQILEGIDMLSYLSYSQQYDPYAPKITANPIADTNALVVSIESADPSVPVNVGQQLVDKYRVLLSDEDQQYMSGVLDQMNARRTKYENDYRNALHALQAEKAKRSLPALDGEGGIRSSRVTSTAYELQAREAETAAAEKSLATLEAQYTARPTSHSNLSVHPNFSEIESQKAVLNGLYAERASKLTVWREGTPEILKIDAEIKQQQERLKEIPPIVDDTSKSDDPLRDNLVSQIAGAKASLAATKVRQAKAEAAAAEALSEFQSYSKVEPVQSKLAAEVAEARSHVLQADQVVDALYLRKNQEIDKHSVRQLSQPTPLEKVRPVLSQYVIVSLLTGFIFAVGLSLMKDYIEDKVTSAEDVFQLCGMEPLAQMPRAPSLLSANGESTALARAEPSAELFDSYRLLRFNLLNATERGYMGSLVITSATGSEGKSDLAADLASVMAASGRRVILVDCNLRNPSVARRFGLKERPGMTDVLIGEAPLEEALVPTNVPGLMVLPAGARTTNPVDLLESSQMVSMHTTLRELSDLVIFDAPSCLTYPDVSVLASFTDSVIVVAELGKTRRALLSRGVNMLQRSSARLVGVVLRDHAAGRKKGLPKAAA